MAMENFLGASLIHNAKYVLAKIKKKGTKWILLLILILLCYNIDIYE